MIVRIHFDSFDLISRNLPKISLFETFLKISMKFQFKNNEIPKKISRLLFLFFIYFLGIFSLFPFTHDISGRFPPPGFPLESSKYVLVCTWIEHSGHSFSLNYERKICNFFNGFLRSHYSLCKNLLTSFAEKLEGNKMAL